MVKSCSRELILSVLLQYQIQRKEFYKFIEYRALFKRHLGSVILTLPAFPPGGVDKFFFKRTQLQGHTLLNESSYVSLVLNFLIN